MQPPVTNRKEKNTNFMDSSEPREGILDVFKFAAHALLDAPSLEYLSSGSATSSSHEKGERPPISESFSYCSEADSRGSSSCGSSCNEGSSGGLYRMEYHAFGKHTQSYDSDSDYDSSRGGDSVETGEEDDLQKGHGEGEEAGLSENQADKEASTHSRLSRIADALFMANTRREAVKSMQGYGTTANVGDDEDHSEDEADDSASGISDISDVSKAIDESDSQAGDDDGEVVDADEAVRQKKSSTPSKRLGRVAGTFFTSNRPLKPVKSSPIVELGVENFDAVEITAEDSFRNVHSFEVADEVDHRGHRRHVSLPMFFTAPSKNEMTLAKNDAQVPLAKKSIQITSTEPVKAMNKHLGKPPLPTTPSRSARLQTGTPTFVSMTGIGRPPLKPDQQKRKSSFSLRSKDGSTVSSPGGGSGHSRSSSFSFGFQSPKSAETPKATTPKKTQSTESPGLRAVGSYDISPSAVEEREQAENEHRASSSSRRQGLDSSAPAGDTTLWQWGSTLPSEHERRDAPKLKPSLRQPSGANVQKFERVVCTEPEMSVLQHKAGARKQEEEQHQLFKVSRKPPEVKAQGLHPNPSHTTEKATTPVTSIASTKTKKRFSKLFRSPSKQEHEEKNLEQNLEENPVEPITAKEAAEMITNLLKKSLKDGENPTENSMTSNDFKPSNAEILKSSKTTADSTPKRNSLKKKKHRFSRLFRSPSTQQEEEEKQLATTVGDALEVSKPEDKHAGPKKSVVSTKENPAEPNTATEALSMVSNLFKMSLHAGKIPTETGTGEDAPTSSKEATNKEHSGNAEEEMKKRKGHARSMSSMSFFHSNKEVKIVEQAPLGHATEHEEASKPVEEKPMDIYDLTNWLWSPFVFPTDESGVGPKDEPIVVVMEPDEVTSDKDNKRKKDKKGLRVWTRGDKSKDSREMKIKEKKTKKKESKLFIANRAAKDSSRRQHVEDTVILQDDLDNFVPSTRAWSQPMPPPPPKDKSDRKSLKSRILSHTSLKKDKMEEMDSGDINIVSFSHPSGKGQEMMLMTESVSKKLHKRSKSHSALVRSLYENEY